MTEPLLHFGDIGLVVERVRGSRRTQRMHAQAIDLSIDAGLTAIFANDVVVDGIRIERVVEFLGAVVRHGRKRGPSASSL